MLFFSQDNQNRNTADFLNPPSLPHSPKNKLISNKRSSPLNELSSLFDLACVCRSVCVCVCVAVCACVCVCVLEREMYCI